MKKFTVITKDRDSWQHLIKKDARRLRLKFMFRKKELLDTIDRDIYKCNEISYMFSGHPYGDRHAEKAKYLCQLYAELV